MSSWQYLLKLIFAGPCTNSCPGANICGSCAKNGPHPSKVRSHGCHGCPSGIGTCRCVPWPSSAGPWSAALIGHPPPASNRKPQQLCIARASANWRDFGNNLGNPWKSTLVVLTMQSLFGVSNSYSHMYQYIHLHCSSQWSWWWWWWWWWWWAASLPPSIRVNKHARWWTIKGNQQHLMALLVILFRTQA